MAKKEKEFKPGEYIVNEEKLTVVYAVQSHGVTFIGKANCGPEDTFDVERGKAIAHIRAVIAQRKFDLGLTAQYVEALKDILAEVKDLNDGIASPHFMRAIQAGVDEAKAQRAHIKDLETRLAKLVK